MLSLIRSQPLLMTLSTDIRDFFADPAIAKSILKELNEEIGYCPILRNLNRELAKKVIDTDQIKFSELNAEDRNEVFVYLGRILESVLTCTLADRFNVKKDRTSSGDVTIEDIIWEIKGTSGKNSWTGSTHASKKEDDVIDFIGVKYGINEKVNVFDIMNGTANLIDEIFIGVFDDLTFIRLGEATKNSSRTRLLISVDDYDKVKEQVAWGNVAYPSGGIYKKDGTLKKNVKYLQLETA
jgi:hypothetical protein